MAASHFALFYDYPDDMAERRGPHREGHLELIHSWKDDGRLVMAGAVGDPPSGGLLVFQVEDAGVVEEFVAADPYNQNGLVVSKRIEPYKVV